MTRTELKNFQTILTARQAELAQAMRKRDGIEIERTPDVLDQVQFASERELSTRTLERESMLLRNVRAALDRIADGSFGECLECEEEISQKRLVAMPWAKHCIACQEQADRNSRIQFMPQERFLRQAA